jgi:hypothetical protein
VTDVGRVTPESVVRRRPSTLCRSTADGYVLHTGNDVVAITGVDADVWSRVIGDVPVRRLLDRSAIDSDDASGVLTALESLQRRHALEVLS